MMSITLCRAALDAGHRGALVRQAAMTPDGTASTRMGLSSRGGLPQSTESRHIKTANLPVPFKNTKYFAAGELMEGLKRSRYGSRLKPHRPSRSPLFLITQIAPLGTHVGVES